MIRKLKDKTLSHCVYLAANAKIKRFGKMLNFNLDSQTRTIELEILLKGEKEPLFVKVHRYEILEEASRYYLMAEEIVTSREWINTVAESFLKNQRFEIPEQYAKMLKMVV